MSEILNLEEVCEILKISRITCYRLLKQQQIPAFKVGSAWRFYRADIDEWIKQSRESYKAISPKLKVEEEV